MFLAVFADVGTVDPNTPAEEFTRGLWYLIVTNIASLVVGWAGHGIVRWKSSDLRREDLRFNNEWHDLFSGEARSFPRRRKAGLDFVFVSVVVEHRERSILHWGLLFDYVLDRTGTLDKIVLTDAQRRFLTPESDRKSKSSDKEEAQHVDLPPSSDRYYSIWGEYLVIEYEGVQTLNVEYYEVLDQD